MNDITPAQLDIFSLEDILWIATKRIDVPSYDFNFQNFFACRHPYQRPEKITAVGRFGATAAYEKLYLELEQQSITLIHSPEQYLLTSELPQWYPLLQDMTPRSMWFTKPPTTKEVEESFSWPIFLKGSRQTSRHRAALSVIHSAEDYEKTIEHFKQDRILHWQQIVCREFIELRPVSVQVKMLEKISPSFEFRTFWWRGRMVGAGPYWSEFASYSWTKSEKFEALAIAEKAASRINAPFLVIDVAQTISGEWIVIECNDGQESGYAGVSPIGLWQKIVAIEKEFV